MPTPISRTRENTESFPIINPLFSAIEAEFDNVFRNWFSTPELFDHNFYVSKRAYDVPNHTINDLLARLPEDARALFRGGALGYYELDFLDFILNYRTLRLLSVVASTGVGKTTLLKFFYYHLQYEMPCLKKYCFLYVDLYTVDRLDQNRISVVLSALIASVSSFSDGLFNNIPVQNVIRDVLQKYGQDILTRPAQLSDIHDLIRDLSKAINRSMVIIFDNLDLLPPQDVVFMATIARTIFFATDQAAVLALRPSTDTIRMEYSRDKAAFFPFIINLVAPSLHQIITSRLRVTVDKLSRDKVSFSVAGRTIFINEIEPSMANVFNNVINAQAQELLLRRLCNNNVRKSLQAFRNFFRYRDFPLSLLLGGGRKEPNERTIFNHPKFSQLLTGIMVGDRPLYFEGVDQVVMNIYMYPNPTSTPIDHILQYVILCSFYESLNQVKTSRVEKGLSFLGVSSVTISRIIDRLVLFGLLTTPDPIGFERVKFAAITDTGRYYIDVLCIHSDYLLNIIHDVDVIFSVTSLAEAQKFHNRLLAVCDLARIVAAEENRLVQRASLETMDGVKPLLAVASVGSLTKRILAALERISLKKPRMQEEERSLFINETNSIIYKLKLDVAEKLEQINLKIDSIVEGVFRGEMNSRLIIESAVPSIGKVEMEVPSVLSPARTNSVLVKFWPDVDVKPDEILALWSCVEADMFQRHFFGLKRSARENTFEGSFDIDIKGRECSFPRRSDIKILDETRTIGLLQLAA